MLPPKRYKAIVYFPGPRTIWRRAGKGMDDRIPVLSSGLEPDPAEILCERSFRFAVTARAWCITRMRTLRNVLAEIHDAPEF